MKLIQKTLGYVVRTDLAAPKLLVFASLDAPGYEVVRGHVEAGETQQTAVLREIEEESGVTAVQIIKQLGSVSWQNEEQHFYLLETTQPLPETFVHIIRSHDADNGLRYAFCWLALTASLKTQLVYGGGAFVDDLLTYYSF